MALRTSALPLLLFLWLCVGPSDAALNATSAKQRRVLSSYQKLVRAVRRANKNAKVCNRRPGCLGKKEAYILKTYVSMEGPLPALQYNAHLTITGDCPKNKKSGTRCIIDGNLKYMVFPPLGLGAPPGRLELTNLIFQRANGGVINSPWSTVVALNVIFRNNINGAVISSGMGNKPAHSYVGCRFVRNNGTALAFGSSKYGMGQGIRVISTVFALNTGPITVGYGGAAVYLAGQGTALFEGVKFLDNLAAGSGGAVFLDETTATFKGVTFKGNKALKGGGGAVAGIAGLFGSTIVSFCGSAFADNTAELAAANSLLFQVPYKSIGVAGNVVNASFCGTPIPPGSLFPPKPDGVINAGAGSDVCKSVC